MTTTKNKMKEKAKSLEEFLFGKKFKLIRYCLKHQRFYQAQVAFDLHWSINITQYYLNQFEKHGILEKQPTSYKTFYLVNSRSLPHLPLIQT